MCKKLQTIIVLIITMLWINVAYSANTATQVDFIVNGLNDTSGNPLSGGKIEVYAAGTTVGKNVWSDKNKVTVLANGSVASGTPITLDTYGKKLCYGDGWYKFIVKNSANTTLFTLDNIYIGNRDGSVYDVSDYADLGAAVTAMASNNSTLLVNTAVPVGTNTTIAVTTTVVVSKAGKFTKSGATLTINGNLIAHDGLIFDGFTTTDITLNPLYVKEVKPQWWGFATTASAANNLTYLTAACNAGIYEVSCPSGDYSLNAFTANKSNWIHGIVSKDNESTKETIFTYAGTSKAITISGTVSVHMSDFQIMCTDDTGSGIDIEGNVDDLKLKRLWIENDGTPGSSQYAVRFNAQGSLGDIENPAIKGCKFKNNYYAINNTGVSGSSRVVKAIIENNIFDANTYDYYDNGGQCKATSLRDNDFENTSKISVYMGSGTGLFVSGNRFDIGTNLWDTFTGEVTTRNPILCGTGSTQIFAVGNTFVSGGTETTNRGKLFKHNDPTSTVSYLFIDPYDGIRSDIAQRLFGGFIFQNNLNTTGETIRIQANTSQTADLLQNQSSGGTATSGINAYGIPYAKITTVTPDADGTVTCNLVNGNVFYYLMATSTSKQISFTNPLPASDSNMQVKLMMETGGSGNTHTVTWASNIYGTSAASTAVNKRDLFVYDYIDVGSVTGWFANSITKGM